MKSIAICSAGSFFSRKATNNRAHQTRGGDTLIYAGSPGLSISGEMSMVLRLQSKFEIARFSDLELEGIVVEIRIAGLSLTQLNRDKGKYLPGMEIGPDSHRRPMHSFFD